MRRVPRRGGAGHLATRPPRRWSIRPGVRRDDGRSASGFVVTVVDPPRIARDGGRSADISSACRGGAAATVWLIAQTVVDPPACTTAGDGPPRTGSTTVYAHAQTVVDAPSRHADAMSAERPPSGPVRGGSTTVTTNPGRI